MLANTTTTNKSSANLGADMAMTPEGKVKQQVKKILDEYAQTHRCYYFFPPANGYGRQGIPDVIACIDGHFVGIECKAGKGTTTELQDRELTKINAAGGTTLIINESGITRLHAYLLLVGKTI